MSNTVEFILKLKDMMSGGMHKVASAAQSAMARVDSAVGRTSRNTTRSISDISRRLDDLRKTRELSVDLRQIRQAGREIERLERQRDRLQNSGRSGGGGSGSGRSGGGMLGMLGMGGRGMLLAGGITAVVAGAGQVAGMGMEAGKTRTSMEVMAGKQAGGKLYGDVKKFAQDSIFGNELFKDAQTMKAFGIATAQVMPSLRMLGDISMGDKQKLESLTLAYSQNQSAGRLMGQDLLQMVNAGFNPLQEISQMTGQSMASLKKKMEDGAISAGMVTKAFQHATGPAGQFYNMTQKIAETPFGKWEAMKGQLEGIFTDLGSSMMPMVTKMLTAVQPFVDMLPAVFAHLEPVFTITGELFSQILSVVPVLTSALGPLMKELSPVFMQLKEALGPLLGTMLKMAPVLIQSLMPSIKNVAHIVSVILTPALKLVGPMLEAILKVLAFIMELTAKVLNAITAVLSKVADGIGWVLNKVSEGMNYITGRAAAVPNELAQRIKQGLSKTDIVNFMRTAGNAHGAAYVDGVIKQYERIAAYLDRIYNTGGTFSKRVQALKNQYSSTQLPEVVVRGTRKASGVDMGTSGLDDSSKKVNGGGVRTITINLGKFFDNMIVNVKSMDEGIEQTADKATAALLRTLYSGGAMLND